MAIKRMFNKNIVCNDIFRSMTTQAQTLYFQINLECDDDGFCSSVKGLMAIIHANNKHLNELLSNRYLLKVGNRGIYVVKHWRLHNTVQKDRYIPTKWRDEMSKLIIESDGSYTESQLGLGI